MILIHKLTLSTRGWSVIDINNYCFTHDVINWDYKEQEIILLEVYDQCINISATTANTDGNRKH